MQRQYDTFRLSDEPKLFGIPVVTGLPCMTLTVVGLLTGYGYQFFLVGALLSFALHHFFGGYGIRFFFSMVYWYLPHVLTRHVFRLVRSPNSGHRVYLR